MNARRDDTNDEPMLKAFWLMVPEASGGASGRAARSRPPRNAPTMPTTMFRKMPCWALVFITMLASQPSTPPITIQAMKVMTPLRSQKTTPPAADAAGLGGGGD